MQLTLSQEARLEQTLSPRMIQFYQMLQCPLQELDRIISEELAENPALELVDDLPEETLADGPPLDPTLLAGGADDALAPVDETEDPVTMLPAPVSLKDHLRWHFMALAQTAEEQRIGLRLIEDINPDGYLEASIGEVAVILGANILEVERVLGLVQRLEPLGVGARDLRECVQLQLQHWREQGRDHTVAWRVTEECWELFCRRQFGACARKLKTSEAAVADAAEFIRDNCHPYPGREFRLPWQTPATAPRAWPEIHLRRQDGQPEFVAEVVESNRLALRIDRIYRRMYDDIAQGEASGDKESIEHVQICVRRARQFIKSLQQRRETVRLIAQATADAQVEFLRHGPSYLQPLTRLEIARRLDVHESTVGRAVAGKWVLLPSLETIPFERFFDGAQPVKLALARLLETEDPRRPLSDQKLTELLAAEGHDVARRTVAKYRLEMKIPPASQRRR